MWVQRDFPDFRAHTHLWAQTDLCLCRSSPLCDVRTIKEFQLENCGIFESPPYRLSRVVRDEWTPWHKLWWNLGAKENKIQCLILLDVEARIHEEAEEIEVW